MTKKEVFDRITNFIIEQRKPSDKSAEASDDYVHSLLTDMYNSICDNSNTAIALKDLREAGTAFLDKLERILK